MTAEASADAPAETEPALEAPPETEPAAVDVPAPAAETPVLLPDAADDDDRLDAGISDVEYRPDGSILARVGTVTYRLAPPGLDDLFAWWDRVEEIDDEFVRRSRAWADYLASTDRDRKAAAERKDVYIPPDPPERYAAIERWLAGQTAEWMRAAFERLATPTWDGTTRAPGWWTKVDLMRVWVAHWRDVPLSPS